MYKIISTMSGEIVSFHPKLDAAMKEAKKFQKAKTEGRYHPWKIVDEDNQIVTSYGQFDATGYEVIPKPRTPTPPSNKKESSSETETMLDRLVRENPTLLEALPIAAMNPTAAEQYLLNLELSYSEFSSGTTP